MNITFIVTKLDLNGGGEKFDILLNAQALRERGHTVQVVTIFSELNNITSPLPFNINEEIAPNKKLLSLQTSAVRLLKKYTPETDVFYLIGTSFLIGAGWYRLFGKHTKPVVAHLNGYAHFAEGYYRQYPLWPLKYLDYAHSFASRLKHRLRLALERSIGVWFVNQLDAITIMSEATASYYRRAGVSAKKIIILPSFHDIKTLQSNPKQPNPFSEFPIGTFHVLSIGRVYIDKGVDLLVRAFSEATLPNTILHIVGTGPQKSELKNFVIEHGLSQAIKFHPWQNPTTLIAFYQHSQLFVYPARLPESMVRTSVEAMALGVPLVVPDTGAATWISEVAKIFKNGDVADLTAKLESAYSDTAFQTSATIQGKLRALEFDYRRLVECLEETLKNAIIK